MLLGGCGNLGVTILVIVLPIILRSQKISQDAVLRETSAQDVVDGSSWLVGGRLGLPRRRTARGSGGYVVAVPPGRPQGGFAAVAISNGVARTLRQYHVANRVCVRATVASDPDVIFCP